MLRLQNHEVYIERETRGIPESTNHTGAKCQVRHELTVHDIAMDQFGASLFGFFHLLTELAEISGQDGVGNAYLDKSPHTICLPTPRLSREQSGPCSMLRCAAWGNVAYSAGPLLAQ
jgi:hypothetical protein